MGDCSEGSRALKRFVSDVWSVPPSHLNGRHAWSQGGERCSQAEPAHIPARHDQHWAGWAEGHIDLGLGEWGHRLQDTDAAPGECGVVDGVCVWCAYTGGHML